MDSIVRLAAAALIIIGTTSYVMQKDIPVHMRVAGHLCGLLGFMTVATLAWQAHALIVAFGVLPVIMIILADLYNVMKTSEGRPV